jgi:hypothetical protein
MSVIRFVLRNDNAIMNKAPHAAPSAENSE